MVHAIGLVCRDRSRVRSVLISSRELRSPVRRRPSTSAEVTALSGTRCPSSRHQLKDIGVAPPTVPRDEI